VNTTALTGASDITTSVRSIKTTVLVEDGQTLVLGGLIDDQITDVEEKVPLLGDIPILGRLFRYRSTQKSKQNLMIFLHPVIIRDGDTATQFSNSKYNFLRSQQTLYRQEKDNSIRDEEDLLPELRLFYKGQPIDSPLTRFDGAPAISTDPVATTNDIDNLAGVTFSNATFGSDTSDREQPIPSDDTVSVPVIARADSDASPSGVTLPQVNAEVVSAITETDSETVANPENANKAAGELIGRVDDLQVDKPAAQSNQSEIDIQTRAQNVSASSAVTLPDQDQTGQDQIAVAEEAAQQNIAPSDAGGALALDDAAQKAPANAASAEAEVPSAEDDIPDTDASTVDSDENIEAPVTTESDELIAMANIWRLGVSNTLMPDDTSVPEVEIVSIVVVDAAQSEPTGAVDDLGTIQIAPSIVPASGALMAPTSLQARHDETQN